jgi:hypothetical protein
MDKFNKPTNEWIEEDVEVKVMTPVFDEKTKNMTLKEETKIVKQKTYYADSVPSTVVCNEHVYLCLDKGKYHFKCRKCAWNRIAPPVTFRFDEGTGILTRRSDGSRV